MTSHHPANAYSLLADIGGTNTRVALSEGARLLPQTVRRYRNSEFGGLDDVLSQFLIAEGGVDCAGVCVAVAGPVHDGSAEMTNLDWKIDTRTVALAARAETAAILNDLQAQGYALGHLPPSTLRPVVHAPDTPQDATRLVVGVGTGFNCAPVYNTRTRRHVPPAEAGHINLPIRTEEDFDLCRFVGDEHGFPATEDVLSGRGLERVYLWVSTRSGTPREKSAEQIMRAMETQDDPVAEETLRIFIRLLGSVTGNLALLHLPFGGIFLVGGVARAVSAYLERYSFAQALRDKGRFSGFMEAFPVSVIEDDYAALTGCAQYLAHILPA